MTENANWKHRTCNSRSTADHWGQGDWHHVTWGLTRWQGGGWRTPTQNLYQLIFLCSLCTGNFSIKSLNCERFLLWLFEAFLASLEKRNFYGGLKFMLSESSDENCKPLGFSLFASPLEISDNGSRWQRRCFWGARKRLCNFEQTASIPVFCQIISRSDLSTTRQTTKPQDACHQHFQHQKCLFRNFPYKNIPGDLKGSPTYKVISKGVSPVRSSSSWYFCCSLSHCILLRLRLARLITTNGK